MGQPAVNLTPAEVVQRWNSAVTVGTLANWRAQGKGPAFLKFGSRVRYPLVQLERWEAANLRAANDNETERV
ncbi:helix-turn-helix domain-containing protein [Achromobacter phage Mano]|uniref:Helix-turn-helix domain-containing protein n=1 Tax=Achromobacter phage Mano TaxID=2767570 RepID=A0A7L8G6B2_9CAUD|nr:helix-turn-helix domain-containing protein [Achromobacter phage Mano]QOE32764.1 helix-turn-helix domain-containing protein [Achromobacter phage Mano]